MKGVPTITVDTDQSCPKCGKKGAIARDDGTFGPCLECTASALSAIGGPMGKKVFDPQAKEWRRMPELDPLVADLVGKHHPHLERAHIVCVGKPKAGKKGNRYNVAKFRKVTALYRTLSLPNVWLGDHEQVDYLIEIGLDQWERLEARQRRIVLDHELCHGAGQDENGKWTVVGHDLEEFRSIVRRYGKWSPDVELFVDAVAQTTLPFDKEPS